MSSYYEVSGGLSDSEVRIDCFRLAFRFADADGRRGEKPQPSEVFALAEEIYAFVVKTGCDGCMEED